MKKRIISICAVLLVVLLLIVGVSCCNGNYHNSEDSEKSTTSSTEQGAKPSAPAEDATEPATQPTGTEPPVIDPTEPEVPEVSPSEPEVPETQPAEPEVPETDPVDPEIPEEKPSELEVPETKPSEPEKEETLEASKPVEPPKPVEYIQGNGYKRVKDFDPATNTGERGFYINGEGIFHVYEDEYIFEVTPETLTYEMWSSWDTHTQNSFVRFCDLSNASQDVRYNYYRITEFENYTCGYENHYCVSESGHNRLLDEMAKGCPYCGEHDCVSFYARNNSYGSTRIDFEQCPKYHNNCEVCGLPESRHDVQSGEAYCNKYLKDTNCHECGEPVKAGECHREIKP